MAEDIKLCLDKSLPRELQDLAKQLSVIENPSNNPRSESPFEMAADWRYLWQKGSTINVRFLGGEASVHTKVENYAHQWEEFANVKFGFVDTGKAQIRVAFIAGNGSWSYLGTQALTYSDQQIPTMNFGWLTAETSEEEYSRVVLHEFGHALGCVHEHQHPLNGIPWDKEKAYIYYGQQGWTRDDVDSQVFRRYSTSITRFSEFDANSIMMYPIPNEITNGHYSVDWNMHLSSTDKVFIGKLYPFS